MYDVYNACLRGGAIFTYLRLREPFYYEEVDCLDAPCQLPVGSTWKLSETGEPLVLAPRTMMRPGTF